MKIKNKKIRWTAAVLAALLAASAFMGCSGTEEKTEDKKTEASDNGTDNGTDIAQGGQGDPVGTEAVNDIVKFKPSELGLLPQERYEYPCMGLNVVLTQELLAKMDSKDVSMLTTEDYTKEGVLKYAVMHWYALTEEQKTREVEGLDLEAWKAEIAKIGALGVYHKDEAEKLDELTDCTQHKEIGKSADGEFVYYMSYADGADEDLKKELEKTEVTLTEMQKLDFYMGITAFSEARGDAENVGDFKAKDINGEEYTKDLFKEYDLTLVNVFTTWCSPCVQEMPELEKLKQEMAEKGVNVVAVVYDSVSGVDSLDQEAIEKAKILADKAGVTFPMLIPDETQMNGRLKGINGFPESFFVDRDGNIVGDTYVGARTLEQWKEVVETELANLKGAE